MKTLLPDNSLRSLAIALGDLPDGDVPVAWYVSQEAEVITGWENYKQRAHRWNDQYQELLNTLGLAPTTQFMKAAGAHFIGIVPPRGATEPPHLLRVTRDGYWVPRKRTKAERSSKVTRAFAALSLIPAAVDFLPGMPNTLWVGEVAYPIHVRRSVVHSPDAAVCVFLGADPDRATEPFEVGEQWSKMKLSTFHLLRERQEAGKR